jgi:hypothetical protein
MAMLIYSNGCVEYFFSAKGTFLHLILRLYGKSSNEMPYRHQRMS